MKIAIAGASGRMGQMLIKTVWNTPEVMLSGVLERPGSISLGQDAGAFAGFRTGLEITDNAHRVLAHSDVLIDFTRPEGTLEYLKVARQHRTCMVIGTTGFTESQKAELVNAAQILGIVFSPNMSVGVNVTLKLLQVAAKYFSTGYDIEIIEAHHRNKVDAPSGTALRMGEVLATALGRHLDSCAVYGRHGMSDERDATAIGFSVIRGGDIGGDHTVMFAGTGERIEITHKSSSRLAYAQGAIQAARFLFGRPAGLYDMWDVLDLC
ncbi:4-hydroxy-tetrahydrodipicolinate reductase [Candidatus Vallotiella sp. (ex Adelges kitamiensis)]|uniref:4-hydroxy-tetrahydrodipicolinate reductase n=1 Tax=Candidatus Vallotiella sp. (ex Adelges kitamiensis) TaxID=2864217 RepID=UPI001CE28C15|nr:4-hydroxy-tetrahydrodipicolinate reductase [Candidatus Vallotia sp. (ex Adelges kitamiensis)]